MFGWVQAGLEACMFRVARLPTLLIVALLLV